MMATDWKDLLQNIRKDFDEPLDMHSTQNQESLDKESEIPQLSSLKVITDKKGRNGKIATIIEGFSISHEEIDEIARKLKKKLGVGGSTRGDEILIQGDHKKEVVNFLRDLNFKVS